MKFYATADGAFWSVKDRKTFCALLRDYTRTSDCRITDYGRALRQPPRTVAGCRKYSSKGCYSTRNHVVLVKLLDPIDVEDKYETFCTSGVGE